MKICVYGAGAVGGHLAVRLARAGHEVSVVARGATLATIRAHGITVHAGTDTLHASLRASDTPAELGPQDLVVSTLKACALPALAQGIAPLLKADTSVVFAQNGIPWWYAIGLNAPPAPLPDLSRLDPGGALARVVPPEAIFAGIINSANTARGPGVIDNNSPDRNRLTLARPDGAATERLAELRAVLIGAGFESPPVDDVRQEIWQKILSNLVTGMTVLVDVPTSDMLADPALRGTAERLVAETVAVAAAHGIRLSPALPKVPAGKKSSLLQDYEQGRPMEVDAQYLAPLAFAHAAGIAAPTLEAVAGLVAFRARARGLYPS